MDLSQVDITSTIEQHKSTKMVSHIAFQTRCSPTINPGRREALEQRPN